MDRRYNAVRSYPLHFKLRSLREMSGYSQTQVAKMLNITQQGYSMWERGVNKPPMSVIEKLRKLYELPSDFFLDEAVSREIARIKKEANT